MLTITYIKEKIYIYYNHQCHCHYVIWASEPLLAKTHKDELEEISDCIISVIWTENSSCPEDYNTSHLKHYTKFMTFTLTRREIKKRALLHVSWQLSPFFNKTKHQSRLSPASAPPGWSRSLICVSFPPLSSRSVGVGTSRVHNVMCLQFRHHDHYAYRIIYKERVLRGMFVHCRCGSLQNPLCNIHYCTVSGGMVVGG